MTNVRSACFVGLGSIGKRHLGNLNAVAAACGLKISVDALRHKGAAPLDAPTATLIRNEYAQPAELEHYDLMFICNPSQLHYETLCALKDKADHFFVEKPVFTQSLPSGLLAEFADESKFYVACPLRHTRTFLELQEYVSRHPVYSVRAICSSYLPDWRPGADYRKLYSAAKESGGVRLDLIHEFDYLFSLFGFPAQSLLLAPKVSHLEIESSDLVSFVGGYPDKTVELHLDYFGRKVQRYCEVFSKDETVRFDFLDVKEDRNESYLREMRYFLDFALQGASNINSIPFANEVLDFVSKSDGYQHFERRGVR